MCIVRFVKLSLRAITGDLRSASNKWLLIRVASVAFVAGAAAMAAATPVSRAIVIAPDKPALHPPLPGALANGLQIADALATLPDVDKPVTMTSKSPKALLPVRGNILTQLKACRKMLPTQTVYIAIIGGAIDHRGQFSLAASDKPVTFREIGEELSKSPARIVALFEVCRDLKSGLTATDIFPNWSSRRVCCIFSVKPGLETAFAVRGTSPFADAIETGFLPEALPYESSSVKDEQSVTAERFGKRVADVMRIAGQVPDIAISDQMRYENLFFANADAGSAKSDYLSALVKFWEGNLESAEALVRQVLTHEPDSPKLLNLLGLILSAQVRYAEALAAYDLALDWTDPNGVRHRRDDVVKMWPVIISNAALAFWRINTQLGANAPKGWEAECHRRMIEGITAEGGRSSYSKSTYARFCEVVLKDDDKAEKAHAAAREVGPDNATAHWNSASHFKELFKKLKNSEPDRAKGYLRKSVECINIAIANPDLEREVAIGTGAAIVLWKFQDDIEALKIPNVVDYRRLIDQVVRKAKRPNERAAALDAFEVIRAKDFDRSVEVLASKISSASITDDNDKDFDLVQLTTRVRAEAAIGRVRAENRDKTPFAQRESLMLLVDATAAAIRISKAAELHKAPFPRAQDDADLQSWKQFRSRVYSNLATVLDEAMNAPDFSGSSFAETEAWKVIVQFAPDDERIKSCIERAKARGPDPEEEHR